MEVFVLGAGDYSKEILTRWIVWKSELKVSEVSHNIMFSNVKNVCYFYHTAVVCYVFTAT